MTQSSNTLILTDFEKDALKEIINLAFGTASAGLADVMGMYVFLNVPVIEVMQPEEICKYIENEISHSKGLNVVEQYYIGKIRGMAYMVLSFENVEEILTILGLREIQKINHYSHDILAQETIIEIGNIIIGACVSKIAEMLSDVVTYLPPRFIGSDYSLEAISKEIFKPDSYVIILKTIFKFEGKEVNGYIFLVNTYDSIQWLKDSINKFIEAYI
ncbi:MAG: chemotaxis protein CheC [Thermodesulfovibrionales bacterium]|nr:chemotaxis protein CheC [Thermodesulfovibrionales bacterium]